MKLIKPNCRIQFTAEDINFIVRALGHEERDEKALVQLLGGEEERDMVLDDETLFRKLVEHTGCSRISNRFYFYVIVRHVLKQAGIENREVADYVAELLCEYSSLENTVCRPPGQEGPLNYFFEMLAALRTADDRTKFTIHAHIGNHSLFLTGVFPERIRSRCERRGFPDLSYYEGLGRASFQIASDHRLAAKYDLAPIYATLAEQFHEAREALNDMSERLVSLGDSDPSLDALLLSTLGKAGHE